jgi:hypothetical protein
MVKKDVRLALFCCSFFAPVLTVLGVPLDIIPTPRFAEPLDRQIAISGAVKVHIAQPGLSSARAMLNQRWPQLKLAEVSTPEGAHIVLWNYAAAHPPVKLNYLERRTLESDPVRAQSYVIAMDGDTMWVIGGSPLGVQYGAATVAQLFRFDSQGTHLEAASIRDSPDFEFRAASDWLLAAELNRWSFDRGQGFDAFEATMKEKLSRPPATKSTWRWLTASAGHWRLVLRNTPP